MATTTFTDLSLRSSRQSKGVMRTMFDRLIEAREREARRYIATHYRHNSLTADELANRESLFEGTSPARR
ncbi:hypothetical protein [Aurantimonas sp. VKM B-3413]|uniref:hypothetical protein n=1 Tax=Aurantimonas sp. VKM B-3413 TaxID=2779401 RepID=UPI001E38C7A3|nr:hypothetical protein [Aurantimonas sp. VKM B-3413]MCB8837907.1 hypothetical protein [Aurantimonas sp. VKM B-3413]